MTASRTYPAQACRERDAAGRSTRLATLLLITALLGACGQKGTLYLPQKGKAVPQSPSAPRPATPQSPPSTQLPTLPPEAPASQPPAQAPAPEQAPPAATPPATPPGTTQTTPPPDDSGS